MRSKAIWIASILMISTVYYVSAQPIPVYLSDEFVANTVTTGNQRRPAVAGNEDGNFLIVWHSDAAQAGFFDIKGQLFGRHRNPIGGEFQVDQGGPNRIMYTPQADAGGNGNYVVVWADFNQTVTDSEIWVRRYDSAGNALGAAEQVNTYTTGRQRLPRVAANDAGQYVVTWESEGQDGSGFGILARLYGADGTPATGELPVNTVTTGDQTRPAVDIDDVGFTVVFNDANTGVEARDIGLAALNDPHGLPQYNLFDVNHRNADIQYVASASTLSSPAGMWGDFWSVAENQTNPLFSFRRRYKWNLDFPIPLGEGDNVTLAAKYFPGLNLNLGYIATDLLNLGGTYDLGVVTIVEEPGVSAEVDRFTVLKGNDNAGVPDGTWADAQAIVGAYHFSIDGSMDGVWGQTGGDPKGLSLQVPSGVVDPDTPAGLGSGSLNLGLAALIMSGQIEVVVPLTDAPAGGNLTINDGTADYGTVLPGSVSDCQATGDCYSITANGPRPGPHWDEAVKETLSTGVFKTWLIHIGQSFADVPDTNPFYAFIENLLHNGITAGGACGGYCPTDGVKRQQMAVFLLKSRFGSTFVPPPATGLIFTDVPITNPFAAWIEALFLLGVTGGCSGGPPPAPTQFCPDAIVNRQQMAVFLLKTLLGSGYVPPAAAGIFQDLPPANPFAPWAEDLYNRQVTGGCVANPLQYCPTNPTNRQQMAAFLVKTFGLLLYGP